MVGKMVKQIFTSSVFKMISTLAVVGMLSGLVLVFVYSYAMPKTKANVKTETEVAIKTIFPATDNIKKIDGKELFKVIDSQGTLLGYAFGAEGNGYQGLIKLIIGVSPDLLTMKGMKVLESQETPGLGAEIANTPFLSQFDGLPLTHNIEYVKNQKPTKRYEIEAITGATISSRAVCSMINKKVAEVKKTLKD